MPNPGCPAQAELTAFASGLLPTAALERVANHVQGCAACQCRLAALDPQDNSVFATLRPQSARSEADLPSGPKRPPEAAALADGNGLAPTVEIPRHRAAPVASVVCPSPTPLGQARPAGPWATGSVPRLESEICDLLQFRLRVMSVVGLVVFTFFLLEHLAEPFRSTIHQRAWDWRDHGLLVLALVAQLVGAVVVWSRGNVTLPRLRRVEWLLVGATTAYLAGIRYVSLATAGAAVPREPDTQFLHVELAILLSNMAWFFHLAIYGLFIPNTFRRCVTVEACLALIPVGIVPLAALVNPVVADRLPMLLGVTAVGMFLTGALAAFGTFKISSLQREAFAARQEARELGQYRLTRRLGSGGMGEVYLAEHRLLKRPCAVKLLNPQHAGDPDYLRRFEREVQATAQLNHPHTVEIYDYGHAEDGTFYYVMEYLDGLTLDEVVTRYSKLSPARAVHVLRQLCSALRAAHGVGLIHRDIKPGNVMLCPDGTPYDRVKLLDFGLVRPVEREGASKLTQEGVVVGTPDYMSPEQVEGADAMDARSDLYSLGALAFFLLTGEPPFQEDSPVQILIAHLQAPVPSVRAHCPDVPEDLEAVVSRCLAKSPAGRFADAAALDRALAGCGCAGQWTEEQAASWWRKAAAAVPS
jgi:serine/threonine-protein kinase